jgi:hypothetical protein
MMVIEYSWTHRFPRLKSVRFLVGSHLSESAIRPLLAQLPVPKLGLRYFCMQVRKSFVRNFARSTPVNLPGFVCAYHTE